MKTFNLPVMILTILAATLVVSGCGKTKRASSSTSNAPVVVPPAPCYNCTSTNTNTTTNTNTDTDTQPTAPPLSYEFTLMGNQVAATGNITTDNVLKVKFKVTGEQGNLYHQATELYVRIKLGGTEVVPSYTGSNYTYGRVGETSNVIDLSSYVTPGQSMQIQVTGPKNDFYCTYAPNPFYYYDYGTGTYVPVNPLYNSYPGCRKEVHSAHKWGGILYVQTSSTKSI